MKANELLQNGLFVAESGTVYAIINGSPYELDVTDSPLAKLPPGDYTKAEVEAALRKEE